MNNNYLLISLLFSLAVTACGGGGDTSSAIPTAAPTQTNNNGNDNNSSEDDSSDDDSSGDDSTGDDSTGDDTPPPAYTVSGKVIDGYISGATVWLDINNNGLLDSEEPNTISGDEGSFSLELSESQHACTAYSMLRANVPVGAIDEDNGEIERAFQMVIVPNGIEPLNDNSVINITPLTTVSWKGVEKESVPTGIPGCSEIVNDQSIKSEFVSLLRNGSGEYVKLLNLSGPLNMDYIMVPNAEQRELATALVELLKKNYAYEKTLETKYPDSTAFHVNFYRQNDSDETNASAELIRYYEVIEGNTLYLRKAKIDELTDEVINQDYYLNKTVSAFNTAQLTTEYSWSFNDTYGYSCNVFETLEFESENVSYYLLNNVQRNDFSTFSQCEQVSLATEIGGHSFIIEYQNESAAFSTRLYEEYSLSVLPNWIGLEGREDEFDLAELISELSMSGYEFDEIVMVPVDIWEKHKYEDSTENFDSRVTSYNHSGKWERTTKFSDGSTLEECSYDEGVSWKTCD
ncbi:hypothetical protein OPS25_01385 [Alteromonas ponticola]|uniref:Carboxypeptidase regulatory-like domain-containing protein n=1 Tax=Alteromonas aquimaris TaxID=2998417 RepID=A0ABT3P322_9ALTE|nr:hypothetical protein [Alteromonas aquimaris]MCW8107155.1 hypothetical protein [Alteromonas aquimaris]